MKKILIATPCLDQKVDAYYTHSLCESIKLGIEHDLDIKPIFLANESILPMARNELLNLAHLGNFDSMVFIDDDEYWDPKILIEIIQSPKDVVTVPVVNKTDATTEFNVYCNKDPYIDPKDGYIKGLRTGTGFLKLSQKVIKDLWDSNEELVFRERILKNICEYTAEAGEFIGEDITLSKKIKELGYTIWINPKHTVKHIGNKIYEGDFQQLIQNNV